MSEADMSAVPAAVEFGKAWVTEGLRWAYPLGAGHGPVNPLWRVAVDAEDPSRVVAARRNSPLVVGIGEARLARFGASGPLPGQGVAQCVGQRAQRQPGRGGRAER